MARPWITPVALLGLVFATAVAQDVSPPIPAGFQGADRKMLQAALASIDSHPKAFFYVCQNAFGERVLRASRRPLPKPGGKHPDAPPLVKDMVLAGFGGRPADEAVQFLQARCRERNQVRAFALKLTPPTPQAKGTPEPKQPAPTAKTALAKKPPAAAAAKPAIPLPPLEALPPRVTRKGERFSNHFEELLTGLSDGYELNGKPVYPRPPGEIFLRLTQSDEPQVRHLATLASLMYLRFERYRQLAAKTNPSVPDAFAARLKQRVDEVGIPDFKKETEALLREGTGGLLDDVFGDVGKALGAVMFTDVQRVNNALLDHEHEGMLLGVAIRQGVAKIGGKSSVTDAAKKQLFNVAVEQKVNQPGFVHLNNRTGKTLHHVVVVSRLIPDPVLVEKTATMNEVQRRLAGEFGILPKETLDLSKEAILLRRQIDHLPWGVVVYVPELPQNGAVKVMLAQRGRLNLAKDADVSVWCDEFVAERITPSNLQRVFNDIRPAARPGLKKLPPRR